MEDLIRNTRSYRRFKQDQPLPEGSLEELIELARLGGSARNAQPWQYLPVAEPELSAAIFKHLAWAGYLPDWPGPAEGERPTAYILCFLNRDWLKGSEREAWFDLGIASQNLLLGAMRQGIAGCRIGAFSKKLSDLFQTPASLSLELVLALGYPAEQVVLEELPETETDIRYWRDDEDLHHVPKRCRQAVMLTLSELKPRTGA